MKIIANHSHYSELELVSAEFHDKNRYYDFYVTAKPAFIKIISELLSVATNEIAEIHTIVAIKSNTPDAKIYIITTSGDIKITDKALDKALPESIKNTVICDTLISPCYYE